MTAKQMIELIQQHHPHIDETEALIMLNDAKNEFCENTGITKTFQYNIQTTAGTLLYDLGISNDSQSDGGILRILNVWIGGDHTTGLLIPRLQGTLKIKDIT